MVARLRVAGDVPRFGFFGGARRTGGGQVRSEERGGMLMDNVLLHCLRFVIGGVDLGKFVAGK